MKIKAHKYRHCKDSNEIAFNYRINIYKMQSSHCNPNLAVGVTTILQVDLPQLVTEGLKYMQMGGLTLKIDRIADGIVHIPSPQINPEATAPA